MQESHIGTLDRRHIVDMGEVGIESGMEAVIAEEGREKKEDDGEDIVDFFRGGRREEGEMFEAESTAEVSSLLEIKREKKGSKESGVKPARAASSRREA